MRASTLLICCWLTLGAAPDQDADGDGSVAAFDCDDADATSHPGAVEVCDGRDNDCDGVAEKHDDAPDQDGDGVTICAPEPDCDDADPAVSPSAPEVCDGLDQDCDGVADDGLDGDGDGVTPCGADGIPGSADDDCDDAEPHVAPGRPEWCDGLDTDCDGAAELDGGQWLCDPCAPGPDGQPGGACEGDDDDSADPGDDPADDSTDDCEGGGCGPDDGEGAQGAGRFVGPQGAPRWEEAGSTGPRPRPTSVAPPPAPVGCEVGPGGAWLGLLLLRRRR